VIVVVPAALIVTVVPEIVATFVFELANDTVNPDDAETPLIA
jgi:hypothetical protein